MPTYTGLDIGYWRVSTDDQDPAMQIDALVKSGIDPDHIFGDVMSGSIASRPGLNRAIKVARRGDRIVVWKLDRLGRSLQNTLDTISRLADDGINVSSLTEPFDTATPWGTALMQIALVFAEMERNLIAERTREGMKRKRETGWKPGKPHSIKDFPKRLARFGELWESGRLQNMTGRQIIEELNRADPDAPKIGVPQVYSNWKAKGWPGFTIPDGDE